MAERALCHRDPERFDKLYRLLWRLQNERSLLSNPADGDVHWLMAREKEVRRDIHKTHAFVRFRKVDESDRGRERFAAWFEPSQFSLRLSAPFFARRFPNMDWVIATPEGCAIWKDEKLIFGPGGSAGSVPDADGVEAEWRAYFAAIFNPARLKISAMCAEMPKKFWRNLPEADLIAKLVADARLRVDAMTDGAVTTPNRLAECLQRQRGKGVL
jgi:uracil-DNA glycosylase